MGDYTEFHFDIKLRKDTPSNVLEIFDMLINCEADSNYFRIAEAAQTHDFFKCKRWWQMFNRFADYKPPTYEYSFYGMKLVINGEIKDRENEIEKFVDFISPFVRGSKKKQYIGWSKSDYANDRRYWHVVREKTYSVAIEVSLPTQPYAPSQPQQVWQHEDGDTAFGGIANMPNEKGFVGYLQGGDYQAVSQQIIEPNEPTI